MWISQRINHVIHADFFFQEKTVLVLVQAENVAGERKSGLEFLQSYQFSLGSFSFSDGEFSRSGERRQLRDIRDPKNAGSL